MAGPGAVAAAIAAVLVMIYISGGIFRSSPQTESSSSTTKATTTGSATTPTTDFAGKRAAFLKWAAAVGVSFPGAELRQSPLHNSVGFFATRTLEPGEPTVCVPTKIAINDRILNSTSFAPVLPEATQSIGHLQVLALFSARMLFDRANEPRGNVLYGPYFDMWSKPEMNPLTWTDSELKNLEFGLEPLLPDYDTVRTVMLKYPEVFGYPIRSAYSKYNFTQAYAMTFSRLTGAISDHAQTLGGWHAVALMPVVDLFNAEVALKDNIASDTLRRWDLVNNGRTLCIGTGRAFEQNQEIFGFYGAETLSKFFPKRGYLHDYAQSDSLLMRIPAAKVVIDPRFAEGFYEKSAATQAALTRKTGDYPVRVSRYTMRQFLAWSRVMAEATPGHWGKNDKYAMQGFCKEDFNLARNCGISEDNEKRAIKSIRDYFTELVEKTGKPGIQGELDFIAANEQRTELHSRRAVLSARYRLRIKEMLIDCIKIAEDLSREQLPRVALDGWVPTKADLLNPPDDQGVDVHGPLTSDEPEVNLVA